MKLLGDAPASPFEEMLIGILSGADSRTDRPEHKAARASTLAAIIIREMARRQFIVVNHGDVIGMQVNYDCIPSELRAAGLSKDEFVAKCLKDIGARVGQRLTEGGAVMLMPEDARFPRPNAPDEDGEVLMARVNLLVPGLAAIRAREERQQAAEQAIIPTHPGGTA